MVAPYLAVLLGIGLAGEDAERVRYLSPPQMRARTSQAVLASSLSISRRSNRSC